MNRSIEESAMNTRTVTHTPEASPPAPREAALLPPVDVIEDANGITLVADLPGVTKDRLDVRVEGDTLSIAGELALPGPSEVAARHAEVQLTHYRRAFTLSKELDAGKIGAEFSHGVLRLRIPKALHAQPRRIEVQVG
jgi:HSP20 family molecular chaperone IbpA